MKKTKKIVSFGLAAAMMFGTLSSAYAMPNNSVIIGNKGYSLDYFFNEPLLPEIVTALESGGDLFFDAEGAGFVDAWDGSEMTAEEQSQLKNIEYLQADGKKVIYENFEDETPKVEGKIVVESVSAINNNGVTVTFAALESSIEDASVVVKDPAGNTVATVAQNLSAGAVSATFLFTAPQESLAAGTWTVDGKEILVKSQDAGLSNLVSNVGVWSEDFAKDKIENVPYTVNVQHNVSTIDLTPSAAEGATITARVTGAGLETKTQVLNNNQPNKIILDSADDSTTDTTRVSITVVAPDQSTSKTYVVDVKRALQNASNNAYATTTNGIQVGGATVQGYKQDIYNYSANVTGESTTINVAKADSNATVYLNGEELTSPPKVVQLSYGANNYTIKIVAADGITSKTYNLVINRSNPNGSTDIKLNGFTQSVGTVSGFDRTSIASQSLTTSVPNSAKELTITPIANSAKASIFVEPNVGANSNIKVEKQGNSFVIKGLSTTSPVDNIVDITVTAESGATQTSTLTITRATATANDVANLAILEIGDTAISTNGLFSISGTEFKSNVTNYSFNVANNFSTINKIDLTEATNATVSYKVNGVDYNAPGSATKDVENAPLKIGENKLEIKVTSANTLNTRTYTININRADVNANDVSSLKSLTLSSGTLTGFTADDKTANTLATSVANNVKDLTITPVATDSKAKISVAPNSANTNNLTVEKSGNGYTVKGLKAGSDNVIEIVVTPENADVSDATTYTLTITKAGVSANDNANLTSAVIAGKTVSFGTNQTSGATNVTFADSSAVLGALTVEAGSNATAVWKKDGKVVTADQPLAVGANNFEVVVTAEDGVTTKVYSINVVRAAETASKQAGITVLSSDKGTYIPTGEVKSDVKTTGTDVGKLYLGSASEFDSATFTVTPTDSNANVVVKPKSGNTAADITNNGDGTFTVKSLDNGDTFDVVVTSPDTNATYTTTITVNRAASGASPFATLSNLTLEFKDSADDVKTTGTAADVEIKPATKTYEYFVRNTSDEVTLTKDGADSSKTVTFELDGKTYESGNTLPLKVGANVVTVNTLAADNVTKDTYTLTINRASSSTKKDSASTMKNSDNVVIANAAVVNAAAGEAYKFSVDKSDSNATVKVSATDKTITTQKVQVAEVDGKYVIDGRTGASTTVTIEVIAADKATKTTETIEITHAAGTPAALTGTASVSGTLKFGEVLTANLGSTNNSGTLTYTWKRGATTVGTNQATYTTVAADIGQTITVEITSSVETGTKTGTASAVIAKADGPGAPSGVGKTDATSLGANDGTLTGVASGQEYQVDGAGSWTAITGTSVTGLGAGNYTVRVAATTTHEAGETTSVTIANGI